MRLNRPPPRRMALSVVSMIDVMMILLFFFMITSSYLNLDMVPALASGEAATGAPGPGASLMLRVGADGGYRLSGQALDAAGVRAALQARLAEAPLTEVLIFPSGAAPLQALVSAMDLVTQGGATRVKVVRIEAAP